MTQRSHIEDFDCSNSTGKQLPTITSLRQLLGYGTPGEPQGRHFYRSVKKHTQAFKTSSCILGRHLLHWKSTVHQKGLDEMTYNFLDDLSQGYHFWPNSLDNCRLQYSKDSKFIFSVMKILFFKVNQQLRKKRNAEKRDKDAAYQDIITIKSPVQSDQQHRHQEQLELRNSVLSNSDLIQMSDATYDIEYSINYSPGLNESWHPQEDFFEMRLGSLISSMSLRSNFCGFKFTLHTCTTTFVRYASPGDEKAFEILRRSFLHFIKQSELHRHQESRSLFFIVIDPQTAPD